MSEWRKLVAASVIGGVGLLTVMWSALAYRQALLYRDEATFCRGMIAQNPASWLAHAKLGMHLAAKGQGDEALKEGREAVRLAPDSAEAVNALGTAIMILGEQQKITDLDRREAIRCFERALQLDPEFEKAHENLGFSALESGKFEEAQRHFQRALELRPSSATALLGMGVVAENVGSLFKAEEWLTKALQLDPTLANAHYEMGRIAVQKGLWQRAADHYIAAVQHQPDHLPALTGLCEALLELEDYHRAVLYLKQLLRLQPNDEAAKAALEQAIQAKRSTLRQRGIQ